MNRTWRVSMAMVAVITVACALCSGGEKPGLTVAADGTLMRGGKPFRGIGVNCFPLFSRLLNDAKDMRYEAALKTLGRRGVPFVRFMCGGFWPRDNALYAKDKAEYFRRLDLVVKSAERNGVGLIPSLFWHMSTVPDRVGEPCDQ